jgi:hypothetical protein
MQRDTLRQRKLSAKLAMAGKGGSWRRWLLEMKAEGYSDTEIAQGIRASFDLPVDPSTVGIWRRQASQGVGSGVSGVGSETTPDTRCPTPEHENRPASGATDRAA